LRPLLLTTLLALTGLTLLVSGGASTAGPGLPPEKEALEQHAALVQALGKAQAALVPKPNDPAAKRLAPHPAERPPSGLVELPSPFPAREYLLAATGWQELMGDRRLTVYAGSLATDRRQGILVAATTGPGADERIVAVYPESTKNGPVEIVAARGRTLTLRDSAGETSTFDLTTRRFGG
jgi:hypothetical protein